MRVGNKKIFHLEAWVVKVMSLYKVSPTVPLAAQRGPGTDRFLQQHFFFNIDMEMDFDDY